MKVHGTIRRSILVGALAFGALLLFSVASDTALAQTTSPASMPQQLHPGLNTLSANFAVSPAVLTTYYWNMSLPPQATAIHLLFNNLGVGVTIPGLLWDQIQIRTGNTTVNAQNLTCVLAAYSGNDQIFNGVNFPQTFNLPGSGSDFFTCVVPPTGIGQLTVLVTGGTTPNFSLTAWVEDGRQFPDALISRALPCTARVHGSIQAAINSLPTSVGSIDVGSGGGVVCIPCGTFTEQITGRSNVTLQGSGECTVVKATASSTAIVTTVARSFGFSVSDLTLSANGTGFTNVVGLDLNSSSGGSFSNIKYDGIYGTATQTTAGIAIQLRTSNDGTTNPLNNTNHNQFRRMFITGWSQALTLNGDSPNLNTITGAVSNNYFYQIFSNDVGLPGDIELKKNCDTNYWSGVGLNFGGTAGVGIIFNSASALVDEDVDAEDFEGLYIAGSGVTPIGIVMNFAKNNHITAQAILGGTPYVTNSSIPLTNGNSFTNYGVGLFPFDALANNGNGSTGQGIIAFRNAADTAWLNGMFLDQNNDLQIGTNVAEVVSPQGLLSSAFANLPASANGTLYGCTDCTSPSNPCVGGGTGALAVRQGGAWVCK